MKKIFSIIALCCLLSVAAAAQSVKFNFSGTWTLDAAKSQLGERSRVETMTLTVVQGDKDIKVDTVTTRQLAPAVAVGDGTRRGGGMGRGFGGGESSVTYSLAGKETIVEVDGPNGKMPVKYKATMIGGKLDLSSSRSFTGPMGEIAITTKDTWTLSGDGKILTVVREQSTPRGTNSSTLVFVKK